MQGNLVLALTAAAFLGAAPLAMAQEGRTAMARGEAYAGVRGEHQYTVVFRGDERMDRKSVAERAMLRAAELTLEKGDAWFMVTNAATQRVDLRSVGSLAEIDRRADAVNDTSAGAGGGAAGATGAGHAATVGIDPGAVGLGTQVDPRLLERRRPRLAYQTTLLIQTGRGSEVTVPDPAHPPEIYDAAAIAASLRARAQQQ
jgi:hypothetical protein